MRRRMRMAVRLIATTSPSNTQGTGEGHRFCCLDVRALHRHVVDVKTQMHELALQVKIRSV